MTGRPGPGASTPEAPRPGVPSRRRPTRSTWARAVAVALVTGVVTLAAACSDEDTVDTVPPPWPTRTTTPDGPPGPPRTSSATSTVSPVSPATVTSTTTGSSSSP